MRTTTTTTTTTITTRTRPHERYCGEIIMSQKYHDYMITLYESKDRWYLTQYYWSISADDWREEIVRRISPTEAFDLLYTDDGDELLGELL
jgi:hypothetical protein